MPTLKTVTVSTVDTFSTVLTLPDAKNFQITVSNNAVIMQTAPGEWLDRASGAMLDPSAYPIPEYEWTPAEPLIPRIHYIDNEPIRGFRFKSRAAGYPAVIDLSVMS